MTTEGPELPETSGFDSFVTLLRDHRMALAIVSAMLTAGGGGLMYFARTIAVAEATRGRADDSVYTMSTVGLILLVIAAGGIVFWYLDPDEKDEPETDEEQEP